MEIANKNYSDRRIFERIKARLPVRFIEGWENREIEGETIDFCAKGLGVETKQRVVSQVSNTPVEIWLNIPDEHEPFYTRGWVVWSKLVESNKYRSGINLESAELMGLSRIFRVSQED
ncbi:MAG: PilZ domain-containing protein [Candidatus Omnitrophica bacterium]|nr:PilZ domain-containing protein [Candidatus Omnitrophota bacterium]